MTMTERSQEIIRLLIRNVSMNVTEIMEATGWTAKQTLESMGQLRRHEFISEDFGRWYDEFEGFDVDRESAKLMPPKVACDGTVVQRRVNFTPVRLTKRAKLIIEAAS